MSDRLAILKPVLGAVLLLAGFGAGAATNVIGGLDGTFESDLAGATATGDATLVPNIGVLLPTEGVQALLLTTVPDAGSTPADADEASLTVASFTVDAAYASIRLEYNFLTNEPDPSFANDSFTVKLVLVGSGDEQVLLASDTFGVFFWCCAVDRLCRPKRLPDHGWRCFSCGRYWRTGHTRTAYR